MPASSSDARFHPDNLTLALDNLTLALVLGNPGSEQEDIEGRTIETPSLPRVWSDHAALKEFLEDSTCTICSGTACDTDLDRHNCLDRVSRFFEQEGDTHCIFYLGKGCAVDGSWILAEDEAGSQKISLADLVKQWREKCQLRASKLFVFSDSCHSGNLVTQAKSYADPQIFVQASCASAEVAMDGRFTHLWIEAHRRSPQQPLTEVEQDTFLQGGQTRQTPEYFADGDLFLGSLPVRFLHGGTGDAGENKAPWEVLRDGLPSELHKFVDDVARLSGAGNVHHADKARMLKWVSDMQGLIAQPGTSRGGSGAPDSDDLSEVIAFFNETLCDEIVDMDAFIQKFEMDFFQKFEEEFL